MTGAFLALPAGLSAQEDLASELARLRAENARLREQVATTQTAPAPQAQTTTTTTQTTSVSEMPAQTTATQSTQAGQEIVVLSPFEVSSERDFGYLKTNAATASRIGMDIQNTPMSISVMSQEFVADTGLQTITDIFRYTASGSPDSSFTGRRPANSATPQGNFTMRGFKINSLLRNGVFRYTSYNLDNIERVEIVKGPAAVFFGQGYPGGVVNYITKQPVFGEIPTSVAYYFGNNGSQGVTFDTNKQLSERVAFRVVGAWRDDKGPQTDRYNQNWNITPSITYIPFEDGKMKIDLSFEYLESRENVTQHNFASIYQDQWYNDYSNPPAAMMTAAGLDPNDPTSIAKYRTRIRANDGAWATDWRKVIGNPDAAYILDSDVRPGARYYDASGTLIYDEHFNWAGDGAFVGTQVATLQGSIEYSPTEWLDARYVYTQDRDRFDAVEGRFLPQADYTFNALNGAGTTGYYRDTQNHQLDLIFRAELMGVNNTLLVGGVRDNFFQQYNANASGPIYWQVPGFNAPENAAWRLASGQPVFPGGAGTNNSNVPVDQVLYDRNGNIRTPQDIYQYYDPGVDVRPDVAKIFPSDRNVLDGYKPELTAYYVNWQGKLLDDRLTLMAGYRKEEVTETGQWLIPNAPWFVFDESNGPAGRDPVNYPPGPWNWSPSYAPTNFYTLDGDSWNLGASFQINDENNIYVTVSKTFKINTGTYGGFLGLEPDAGDVVEDALAWAAYNGETGYDYLGTRITSVQQGLDVMNSRDAFTNIKNEEGFNYEIGWKTSLNDNKLVGTVSVFQGIRRNEKLDDGEKQSTANEPYNYSNNGTSDLFSPGPIFVDGVQTNPGVPPRSVFYSTRVFRWRTAEIENTVTGAEFEFIYTPIPNYQAVINGAWLWQAESTFHPVYKEGLNRISDIYLGQRIENVPEFRFNLWNKYTFTETALRGLSLGLGMRYSSETIFSRSTAYDAWTGGFTAGDYLVFDGNVSYPWSVGGLDFVNTLQVTNLTDEVYYEGSYVGSNRRTWRFYTSLKF